MFDYLVSRIRFKLVVFSAFATFHLNVVGVGCVEETVGRSNGQGGPSCCVAGALQGGARDRDRGFLRGATAEEDRVAVLLEPSKEEPTTTTEVSCAEHSSLSLLSLNLAGLVLAVDETHGTCKVVLVCW